MVEVEVEVEVGDHDNDDDAATDDIGTIEADDALMRNATRHYMSLIHGW